MRWIQIVKQEKINEAMYMALSRFIIGLMLLCTSPIFLMGIAMSSDQIGAIHLGLRLFTVVYLVSVLFLYKTLPRAFVVFSATLLLQYIAFLDMIRFGVLGDASVLIVISVIFCATFSDLRSSGITLGFGMATFLVSAYLYYIGYTRSQLDLMNFGGIPFSWLLRSISFCLVLTFIGLSVLRMRAYFYEQIQILESESERLSRAHQTLTGQMKDHEERIESLEKKNAKLIDFQSANQAIGEYMEDLIYFIDQDLRLTYMNPAAAQRAGKQRTHYIGRSVESLYQDIGMEPSWISNLEDAIQRQIPLMRSYRYKDRKGEMKFFHIHLIPTHNDMQGNRLACLHRDLSDLVRMQEKITYLAYNDAMTGLPNQTYFLDAIDSVIADYGGRPDGMVVFCFKIIGIDKPKKHQAFLDIDKLEEETSERLLSTIRKSDMVAKLNTGVFALMLRQIESEDVVHKKAAEIEEVMRLPFYYQEGRHKMRYAMGIAIFPQNGKSGHELLEEAIIASDYAQEMGDNTYHLREPQIQS